MANIVILNDMKASFRTALVSVPPLDAAMLVDLVKEPFVASGSLDPGSLVLADFPGYAQKTSGVGALLMFDPITGVWSAYIKEPAGGWKWTRAAGAGTPQTIYGVFVDGLGAVNIPPVLVQNELDTVLVGDLLVSFPAF